jgi:tetratricopeptide (TPR) repeat protein
MRIALISAALLFALPALAEAPAAAPVKPVSQEQLFHQLAKAESAEDAHPIEKQLTGMFRVSGSATIDLLMTRAETALGAQDNKTAQQLLKSVTDLAPGYAEGWHARAGLEAAADNDTAAMVSLQKAVQLNPRQFEALSELAGMLEDYGDKSGALKLYRRALALDPQLEGAAQHVKALTRAVEGQDI